MKLHDDVNPSLNTVTAYGDGFIEINQKRFETAITFGPSGEINVWPAHHPQDISTELLLQACGVSGQKLDPLAFLEADQDAIQFDASRPEVLLVGTGERQVLLPSHILTPLLRLGVGVECMSSGAAARTFNILMAEGRQVIAALILEKHS